MTVITADACFTVDDFLVECPATANEHTPERRTADQKEATETNRPAVASDPRTVAGKKH